jgi:hypothetical protein
MLLCLAFAFPIGRDWQTWDVSSIEQIQYPYTMPDFTGMPFAFFALPHSLLDIDFGNAINLTLNILVIGLVAYKFAGDSWHIAIAITMTSPMAINLIMSNNIDWIPLASFLFSDWLAYPMLAMKPQVLAGAAIIRFKRNPNLFVLIPLIAMLIASVLIWGTWWTQLGDGLTALPWNFAPFPYFIPIGIYLLWIAWKRDDEIISACATPFFVPYFAPYSLTSLQILLACKYRKQSIWLWCFSWWFVIITAKRIGA